GAAGGQRRLERRLQLGLTVHDDAISAEALSELLRSTPPVTDGIARNLFDLLLDANEADLLVAKDEDDRQLLPHRHEAAAVAGKGTDGPLGMSEPRRERARNGEAHRAQSLRGEKLPRSVGLPLLHDEQAARTGVTGRDRIARQRRPCASRAAETAPSRPGERFDHVLAKTLGDALAPAGARARPFGEAGEKSLDVAHDLRRSGHERVGAGHRREREDRRLVRPGLWLQLDRNKVGVTEELALDEPADPHEARRDACELHPRRS